MNEHGFVKAIHRRLPTEIYALKVNLRFNNGVPDAWYSGKNGDLWVEYKWLPRTPTRRFTPGLSELQRKWLNDRREEGRSVAVIVGCPAGGMILTDGEWNQSVTCTGESWRTNADVARSIEAMLSSTSTAPAA